MFEDDVLTDEAEKLLSDNKIEKLYFDSLTTLKSDNKKAKKDYLTIMNENLDLLRMELYKGQ